MKETFHFVRGLTIFIKSVVAKRIRIMNPRTQKNSLIVFQGSSNN